MTSVDTALAWHARLRVREQNRATSEEPTERSWKARFRAFGKGVSIVLALALLCFGLLQTALFRVDHIVVAGATHYKTDDVIRKAGLRTGTSVAFVPVEKATKRLVADPWIASAKITREWPHGVRVVVKERTAVAIARQKSGAWSTLAEDGMVLAVGPAVPVGLPVALDVKVDDVNVGGHAAPDNAVLLRIAHALPDSLRPKVTQLQRQNTDLRLGLRNDIIVELGDDTRLGNKLMAAAAVLSHADNAKIAVLDVRSPNLPIATPPRATAAQAASTSSSASTSTSASASTSSSTRASTSTSTTTPTRSSAAAKSVPAPSRAIGSGATGTASSKSNAPTSATTTTPTAR